MNKRIAICLYGLVGQAKTWKDGGYVSLDSQEIVKEVANRWKIRCKYDGEVDFYIHSWDEGYEDELRALYKPKNLKTSQEWIITNIDPSNIGVDYTITSNKNKSKCISYYDNEITTPGYTLKMLDCDNQNSNFNWKIKNYNDAYKNIVVGTNTAFVLDNLSQELDNGTTEYTIGINNMLLDSNSINSQCWIIKPTPSSFLKMRDDIYKEIVEIKNLVKNILPNKVNNNAEIGINSMKIEETILKIDDEMAKLAYKTQQIMDNNPDYDPELLEGKYQYTKLNTNTNFYKYVVYIFFALFIIVSLIYIYINPDETSLDMFIVSLAVFILMYYIYDYFKNKK